jgi:glycosyltransferase involved in cell wall biosynthesis
MKILWLMPSRPAGAPSGGDLYDSLVIAGLRKRGHRVEVTSSPPSRVNADVIVQDELGFREFLPFNRAQAEQGARRIALVHVTSARLGAKTARLEAEYLASTHAAIFVSEHARAESLRLLKVNIDSEVIPPGADRLHVSLSHRERVGVRARLLCVGHLTPNKGQLELLETFKRSGLDASLVLVGDGSIDRKHTARVEAQLKRTPKAMWLGPLNAKQLATELARADVFINASEYESWGMAAAEAQAAGLPVVSWSKGGLWEFLKPGVDSLQARSLTPSLLKRLGDRALVEQLTRGARRARIRSWKTVAEEFESFLMQRSAPLTRPAADLSPLRKERFS